MPDYLQKSVTKMLQPLIRLLLRHGVTHAEFADWAKHAFVTQAQTNFGVDAKKPTVSRISIVTGINRKEVKRLLELSAEQETRPAKHNRAARVVTGWIQDQRFLDETGQPAELKYGEPNEGFSLLVKEHSGDVPARAVLDELVRVGTAIRTEAGLIKLVRDAYIPHESKEDMIAIFGDSAADLLDTLDHNIASAANQSRLQLSVVYDNLSFESVSQFHQLSREKATKMLKELDRFLSSKDRDLAHTSEGGGRYRAGLGLYLIENELPEDDADND